MTLWIVKLVKIKQIVFIWFKLVILGKTLLLNKYETLNYATTLDDSLNGLINQLHPGYNAQFCKLSVTGLIFRYAAEFTRELE